MSQKQLLPLLTAKDLDWSMKSPCDDCPFLKTSPFHEGIAGSIPTYCQSIQDGVFVHTCHKTDNRDGCDGPRNYPGKTKHCSGAILSLLKTGLGMDLQLALLQAAERGEVDLHAMTDRAESASDVFTIPEMLAFYGRKLKEIIRSPAMRAKRRQLDRKRHRKQRRS